MGQTRVAVFVEIVVVRAGEDGGAGDGTVLDFRAAERRL